MNNFTPKYLTFLLILYSVVIPLTRAIIKSTAIGIVLSLTCDLLILLIFYYVKGSARIKNDALTDMSVITFIFYGIFTAYYILLLNSSHPELYLYGIHMTIFPMLLYFGHRHTKYDIKSILKTIMIVGIVHIAIGFVTYKPITDFFPGPLKPLMESIASILTSKIEDNFGLSVRMRSVLDSLSFGNIAGVTSILCFYYLQEDRCVHRYILLLLSLVAVAFSYQRSAWVATFVGVFILFIFQKSAGKIRSLLYFISTLPIAVVIILTVLPSDFLYYISLRLFELFSAGSGGDIVNSRVDQWVKGIEYFEDFPLGMGIGLLGHKSAQYGDAGVYDGNYIKLLSETGIIGFSVFISILIGSVINFISLVMHKSYTNESVVLFAILVFYIFQAIGTNVWDLYYTNLVFWIVLGTYYNNALMHCRVRYRHGSTMLQTDTVS